MKNLIDRFKSNWKAGITVALVSLPLSIALAVASGVSPVSGISGAFWAGLVVALIGGCKYNIIGPTGALITVLFTFGSSFGFEYMPILTIFSGFFILLAHFLRLEKYLVLVPSSVMYGFATGVAILIMYGQLNLALGIQPSSHSNFFINLNNQFNFIFNQGIDFYIFTLFLFFLGLLFLIRKLTPNLPAVLFVSILGILLGFLSDSQNFLNLKDRLVLLQDDLLGNFSTNFFKTIDFHLFQDVFQDFNLLNGLLNTSLLVAVIIILETLISAKIADSLTFEKSNNSQEILALGVANIVAGLFAGLASAGVFIRTGLNIKSGATDQTSSFLASVLTGLLAVIFLPLFQFIPMVVIASILFKASLDLIEVKKLTEFFKEDKKNFLVLIIVAVAVLVYTAGIGVLLGVALTLLIFVDNISKGEYEISFNQNKEFKNLIAGTKEIEIDTEADLVVYNLQGILAYLNSQSHFDHLQKLAQSSNIKTVIIRLRDVPYIDLDGRKTLIKAITELQKNNKQVLLTGLNKNLEKILKKEKIVQTMYQEKLVFKKTQEALLLSQP